MCGELDKIYHHPRECRSEEGGGPKSLRLPAAVSRNMVITCRSKESPFFRFRELREAKPAKEGRTIFFSRHGESVYNVEDRIGGDPELTPRGQLYAKALGSYINALGYPSLTVWTSSLRRTIATAGYIRAEPDAIRHDPRLDELRSGTLDSFSYSEIKEKFPDQWEAREKDKLTYQYPAGESYLDCSGRIAPVLAEIEAHYDSSADDNEDDEHSNDHERSPLVIVSHQATLRCLFGYLLDKPVEAIPFLRIPQHTLIRVTYESGENVIDLIRFPVAHIEQGANDLEC